MKRIVWTFGLISGAVISVLMASTMLVVDKLRDRNFNRGGPTNSRVYGAIADLANAA